MLNHLLITAGVMLLIAMGCNMWRLLIGPDVTDRVLALDTLYINAVALLVLTGAVSGKQLFYARKDVEGKATLSEIQSANCGSIRRAKSTTPLASSTPLPGRLSQLRTV